MKKAIHYFILLLLFALPAFSMAVTKDVPFTLDDRDRITRTEQKIDDLRSEMDARFDQLSNFLWAIIGIFTTMMVSIFGFAFWDRKLSLAPMKRDEEKIKEVLREYSKTQPKLAEILRNLGL